MLERLASSGQEMQLGPVKGTQKVLKLLRDAEDRDPFSMDLVGFGGAPMSKSMAPMAWKAPEFESDEEF